MTAGCVVGTGFDLEERTIVSERTITPESDEGSVPVGWVVADTLDRVRVGAKVSGRASAPEIVSEIVASSW